VYAATARL